jgi:hypothetical protein
MRSAESRRNDSPAARILRDNTKVNRIGYRRVASHLEIPAAGQSGAIHHRLLPEFAMGNSIKGKTETNPIRHPFAEPRKNLFDDPRNHPFTANQREEPSGGPSRRNTAKRSDSEGRAPRNGTTALGVADEILKNARQFLDNEAAPLEATQRPHARPDSPTLGWPAGAAALRTGRPREPSLESLPPKPDVRGATSSPRPARRVHFAENPASDFRAAAGMRKTSAVLKQARDELKAGESLANILEKYGIEHVDDVRALKSTRMYIL